MHPMKCTACQRSPAGGSNGMHPMKCTACQRSPAGGSNGMHPMKCTACQPSPAAGGSIKIAQPASTAQQVGRCLRCLWPAQYCVNTHLSPALQLTELTCTLPVQPPIPAHASAAPECVHMHTHRHTRNSYFAAFTCKCALGTLKWSVQGRMWLWAA